MKCKYPLPHQPQKCGLLKSSWNDIVAKLERWVRKNKSEVVHIKSRTLCNSCRWDFQRNCCGIQNSDCRGCARYQPSISRPNCECLRIFQGDPCPYYEEAHHD